MKDTLTSGDSDRFALMNNGVTIIAKSLLTTGDKFTMNDFQIVNGCQTSNILYDNRSVINDSVRIPVRIISTTDDAVTESVITATNRQTEVKQEQFFALKEFSKNLNFSSDPLKCLRGFIMNGVLISTTVLTLRRHELSYTKTSCALLVQCSYKSPIEPRGVTRI
jgi:hypothetical protein